MKTAILAILMFCVMIFPHELGHFIAAKKFGVKVNEFSFGMGPAIFKRQGKETLYAIRLFPIGGYCAMEGEDESSDDARAFSNKKPWQKIIVLVAGSFMNVVCALAIMIVVVGSIGFTTTTIDKVEAGSPAQQAQLMSGDEIISIGGNTIEEWADVSTAIEDSKGETVNITFERDGSEQSADITPSLTEDGMYKFGITCKVSHNPLKAVVEGTKATGRMTVALFDTISQLFTGGVSTKELSGPVGMVQMVNQTTSYGLWYYGFLTSLICINLAIVNMLPLPALDGGRVIFAFIEMITGKEVNKRIEGGIHFFGLMLLLGLMVYVTMNDVTRIFG